MNFLITRLLPASLILFAAALSGAEPAPKRLLPLAFEQNLGQTREDVRFLLRRDNRAVLFFDDRIVFGAGDDEGSTLTTMRWASGSNDVIAEGVDQTGAVTHYYVGNDPSRWFHGIPSFARIRYEGVYPGIDLVFYHADGELEYDFVLSPGADPSQIRLYFQGEAEPELTASGSLRFAGERGAIEHRKPVLYQLADGVRKPVEGAFALSSEGEIRFEAGEYDRELALVVDPRVGFSSYLGRGSDRETVSSVVQVVDGDLIAAGTTRSLDDFAGLTPVNRPTGANGVVVRLRGSNTLPQTFEPVEVMIVGGSGDEGFIDVIESPNGLLLGGTTDSPDFPFGSPSGGNDMFVVHWANGGGIDNGVRFGSTGDDMFGHFARRNMLGVPQASVHDYDGAGLSFFTKGKISAGDGEFIQVRQWGMDTLMPWREGHLLAQFADTTIETSNIEWSEDRHSLVMAGSANNSLFPAAAHPGDPGVFRAFLAEIPIDGPSPNAVPQPIQDVFFFDWPGAPPTDETHITGLALSPAPDPFVDSVSGRLSALSSSSIGDRGQVFRFQDGFLSSSVSFALTNDMPAMLATRRLDYVFPVETVGGGTVAGQKRGVLRIESDEDYDDAISFSNQYSFENDLAGATMAANGRDVIVFGAGDRWMTNSGSAVANGPADAWLTVVEYFSLYPDAIVTAGQFKWAPLAPYGIYTIFYDWPRIQELQVLGLVNGKFPKSAQGMQVLLNGEPAAMTAISGTQINFIAHHNVNANEEATVQLMYEDGDDVWMSNPVTMPTIDRWANPFEAGTGFAAATHSAGNMTPTNPLPENDLLVWYFAGAGSLGDDSIGADELTPGDKAFPFPGPTPEVIAITDGAGVFELGVDYFGNSPGSTPGLGQMNLRFPQGFWDYCATSKDVEFTLNVTGLAVGSNTEFRDPLGARARSISETQGFTRCP